MGNSFSAFPRKGRVVRATRTSGALSVRGRKDRSHATRLRARDTLDPRRNGEASSGSSHDANTVYPLPSRERIGAVVRLGVGQQWLKGSPTDALPSGVRSPQPRQRRTHLDRGTRRFARRRTGGRRCVLTLGPTALWREAPRSGIQASRGHDSRTMRYKVPVWRQWCTWQVHRNHTLIIKAPIILYPRSRAPSEPCTLNWPPKPKP